MWDAPFDESMLSLPQGVVIHCPEECLADELFEIFKRNGVGENWPNLSRTNWNGHGKETAYFVKGKNMLYGPKKHAKQSGYSYSSYAKCTFYGTPDFEVASNDELRGFLGIGGGQ